MPTKRDPMPTKKIAKKRTTTKKAITKKAITKKGRALGLVTSKVVAAYNRAGSFAKAAVILKCSAATVKYHVHKSTEAANVW